MDSEIGNGEFTNYIAGDNCFCVFSTDNPYLNGWPYFTTISIELN